MNGLAYDFWRAVRLLLKSPGVSIIIISLLGFGIGTNAALFRMIYAVLMRPIPGVAQSQH